MEMPMARHAGRTRTARRTLSILLVACTLRLAALLGGCASAPPAVPDIESWGSPNEPYDDPIEVAAVNALGPRPAEYAFRSEKPIRLGEFLVLDRLERERRQKLASALVSEAETWHWVSGVDSLPHYLEALRIDPGSVRAYQHAARITLDRGQNTRARALALQAVRLESQSGALWAILAETYARAGDDLRARRCLEYALAVGPEEVTGGWQSLVANYLRAGDTARADSLLRRAPEDLASPRVYVDAVRARERGDLATARSLFAAAASDPEADVAMLIDWGNAEYAMGAPDAAETAYRRALRRRPEEPAALNGLGVVQRARGDAAGAAGSFARIVARHPRNAAAQFNLAGASLEAAERLRRGPQADSLLAMAAGAFTACADLGFRAPEARLRRAEVRLLRGQAEDAYREARELIPVAALAGEARLLAARAAVAAARPPDVVAVLAPAYQANSLAVDGLDLLGNAYLDLEMPQYAAPVLERAHARRPGAWKTAVNYAIALSETGELARAESLLRPLLATHPDEPYVLQNLAAVLQRRGRRTEAEKLLRRLEQVRPR
jgi:tetratricopeptide (TPR) repeat protein